ncbi:RNA-directed DNA polymerase, eukaryota [Tanacetum coccineum]
MAFNDRGGSKYSDVSMLERLSCNIYITNFPKQLSAKELWNTCAKFGIVFDVYVPNKVSKQGKPFTFACFNKVNDVESLIRNLRSENAFIQKRDAPVMVLEQGSLDYKGEPALVGCVKDFQQVDAKNDDDDVIPYSFQSHVTEDSNVKENANEGNHVERTQEQPYVPSGDLFGLEDLILKSSLKGTKVAQEMNCNEPKFPPGFTPPTLNHSENVSTKENLEGCPSKQVDPPPTQELEKPSNNLMDEGRINLEVKSKSSRGSKQEHNDSMARPTKPVNGFSIMEQFHEFINIGQAMGYGMKGFNVQGLGGKEKKQWVKWLCQSNQVNFLSLQETKMVSFDVFVVRAFWGNMLFDFATSLARGRSGSILCSPQELPLKRDLWSYMAGIIDRWHGKVIVMGDFNEVRYALEQYGSLFHSVNAGEFNRFIANSHLTDIPLGGYSFTWSDKHASKMRKLDLFLIS